MIKIKNIVFAGIIILLASACGGGGGSSSTPALPSATVSISASATSTEVNSTISVTWSSTLASSCSASGAWSGTKATSGTEEVTIAVAGSNSFSLSCSGSEITTGSGSVAVEGFRYFGGSVIDGYLRGATVYIDANDNFTMDSDEPSVTTDNLGIFSNLKYLNGTLVSEGGIDLDTGVNLDSLQLTNKLSGHSDIKVITPLTTLAAAMSNPENINTIFGIDAAIDIGITDPIPSLGDSTYDNIYEKGNQLTVIVLSLQNSINAMNASTDNSKDYFASIGEEIETAYAALEAPGIIDIESAAFISAVVENIVAKKASSTSDTIKENIKTAIGSVIPIIQVKTSASATTAIQNFSFGTLQTDIKAIANGTASAETITSYTADILTYIANDQNLDSGDLAPNISAITDSVTTSEDASVSVNVLSNDSYVTSAPISVTAATNGISGTTSISNNLITYTPAADYNGTDTFTYTITQGDKTSTANVTVTIEAVNDAPVLSSTGSFSVVEGGNSIVSIAASDVENDSLTFTLTGTDAASFAISASGELSFVINTSLASPADVGTNNVYDITIAVSDGVLTTTKDFSITVVRKNTVPIFASLPSTLSVAENSLLVQQINAIDQEGDAISYSLSGTHASDFNLSAGGLISFKTAKDFENLSNNRFDITITISDGSLSATRAVVVMVKDEIENQFGAGKFGTMKLE